jgi:hypothetical protein
MSNLQTHEAEQFAITAAYEALAGDYETRADLRAHEAFRQLARDSCGNPCVLENHYHCGGCGEVWDDIWSCACDALCPTCGEDTVPEESIWAGPDEPELRDLWDSLPQAEHTGKDCRAGMGANQGPLHSNGFVGAGAHLENNAHGHAGVAAASAQDRPFGDHPDFASEDWRSDVAGGRTRLGYTDWIIAKRGEENGTAPAPDVKSYRIGLAVTVSVYGTVNIEAENLEAALEKVRADAGDAGVGGGEIWITASDVDWSTQGDFRVLGAVNEDDETDCCGHIELTVDSFDVISADHLKLALAANRINSQ